MQRASLENTLILGKIEGGKRRGQWRIRWLDSIPTQWTWMWANSGRWWRIGKPGVLQSMGSQRVRHDLATEQKTTIQWHSKDRLARPITQSKKLDETICELCVIYVCAIPTNEKTWEAELEILLFSCNFVLLHFLFQNWERSTSRLCIVTLLI